MGAESEWVRLLRNYMMCEFSLTGSIGGVVSSRRFGFSNKKERGTASTGHVDLRHQQHSICASRSCYLVRIAFVLGQARSHVRCVASSVE